MNILATKITTTKSGFTLVELSIVLVIIGLLIGGILVGQSLIESTKIQAQIKQIQSLDSAIAGFIAKYKSIPGDSRLFSPAGNGDKKVKDRTYRTETGGAAKPLWWDSGSEIAYFWVHLGYSGFSQNGASFTATIPTSGFNISTSPKNAPQAVIDKKAGIMVASSVYSFAYTENYTAYQISDYTTIPNANNADIQSNAQPIITPIQALAIDQKMDDGLPYLGTVRTSGTGNVGFGQTNGGTDCANWQPSYLTTNTKLCSLLIGVLSQSGGINN